MLNPECVQLRIIRKVNFLNNSAVRNSLTVLFTSGLILGLFTNDEASARTVSTVCIVGCLLSAALALLLALYDLLFSLKSGYIQFEDGRLVSKSRHVPATASVQQILRVQVNRVKNDDGGYELKSWGNFLWLSFGQRVIRLELQQLSAAEISCLRKLQIPVVAKPALSLMMSPGSFFGTMTDSLGGIGG